MFSAPAKTIKVCDSPACWLRGSAYIHSALESEYRESGWQIERTSCLGLCDRAPAVLVRDEQCGPLESNTIPQLKHGWRGSHPSYQQPLPGETRRILADAEKINPDSIDSAISVGIYSALQMSLKEKPEKIIEEIENSGLRGRGGAGFPTGRKMRFVAQSESPVKYIICNADESEPLVFKDRVLIDTNPHKLLEGMALAAYAVGAQEGYIYIRGEYKPQALRLENAIHQAEERGLLGERIQGTDFSFHIKVHRGAGAYICGEETALIESLEGKRGEPRIRPPFPATYGYHGHPTVVNNVETFATIPDIILHGASWYRSVGTSACPGTKLFIILGHVNRPTLFEAPYGISLRQAIEEFGGGMQPGSKFNFALTGGAAGTLVPSSLLDVPIDYTSTSKGVSLGAGAFLICDQTVSPLVLLRELLFFFEKESCGKCTPCRVGTHQSRQILDRMIARKPITGDLETLQNLADLLQNTSFCGLGQSVAIPMKSAFTHFAEHFKE
jgi:NADH:ubiquinone oxidoreductase subunit F (NADH-binding)